MNHDGVFVTASGFLSDRLGGAQICTREYIATLRAAGINLHLCPYELDGRVSTRIFKKLWPSSYFRPTERGLIERVRAAVDLNNAEFVFLNQVQLAVIAAPLRRIVPSHCKIVALSHGLESTDLLQRRPGLSGSELHAASANEMGRIETRWRTVEKNLSALAKLSGQWIGRVHSRRPPRGILLNMAGRVGYRGPANQRVRVSAKFSVCSVGLRIQT